MAEPTKSVLFVDYDSLRRSLAKVDPAAADRIVTRLPSWIGAIESGRLAPSPDSGRRKILMRRCYADPATLGERRSQFTGNGFQVVDCPPLDGRDRNAADIHVTLDAIDALGHPTAYDEFILLSADSDFSPLLIRLRAHNRQTIVYANAGTAPGYKAIADGMVEEGEFAAFMTAMDEVKQPEATAARAPAAQVASTEPPADRTEIETLARKVHAATNVPLFSPRSYLELFKVLAEEIREKGYHFQDTAENVAAKLTAGGRNATRRQIVFIVKGLALKGHVFSNSDTPEHLADVFREQVSYLIRNAGLELTERETAVLPAWIIGRAGSTAPAEIDTEPLMPSVVSDALPKSVDKPLSRVLPDLKPPKRFSKPMPPTRTDPAGPPAKAAAPPQKPVESAKPLTPVRTPLPPRPTPMKPSKPGPFTSGQKPAASPISRPSMASSGSQTPRPGSPTARPPAKGAAERPQEKTATPADKEAVESTILAAIAQAVDVLVEDRSPPKPAPAAEASSDEPAERPVAAEPQDSAPAGDSGDIGDEIQRIIATYNRDRQQTEQE